MKWHEYISDEEKEWYNSIRDIDGHLPPPFQVYPLYAPSSMGWRMGTGEIYMIQWHNEYTLLNNQEKNLYRKKYNAPLYWFNFYWDSENIITFFISLIIAFITWPLRVILRLIYSIFMCPKFPKK